MTSPVPDDTLLEPGTFIADKYKIGRIITRADNSVVYRAEHRFLDRAVAVKVLAATDEASEKRFAREARLAGGLDHPNIVDVYELGYLKDGRAFMVLEHVGGESVRERVERDGPFSIADAMLFGRQALSGLTAAHEQQIVHRDLRPETVYIATIRGEPTLKIVDFGISRRYGADASGLTSPGTLLRKAGYLAPELLQDGAALDHRVDVYSCGVLLYYMLTGRPPFEGSPAALLTAILGEEPKPPSQIRPQLTADVDRVIITALAKRPEDRFPSAQAMSEALRITSLFAEYVTS